MLKNKKKKKFKRIIHLIKKNEKNFDQTFFKSLNTFSKSLTNYELVWTSLQHQ